MIIQVCEKVPYSLLTQSHNAIWFGGSLLKKQYKLLALETVSCFSELDIHCLNANNPPNNIALWDCASSDYYSVSKLQLLNSIK